VTALHWYASRSYNRRILPNSSRWSAERRQVSGAGIDSWSMGRSKYKNIPNKPKKTIKERKRADAHVPFSPPRGDSRATLRVSLMQRLMGLGFRNDNNQVCILTFFILEQIIHSITKFRKLLKGRNLLSLSHCFSSTFGLCLRALCLYIWYATHYHSDYFFSWKWR